MVSSNVNTSEKLEDLSPVDIYEYATRGKYGRTYNQPFTRHKTLEEARVHIIVNGGSQIYKFDFDKEEWVEIK